MAEPGMIYDKSLHAPLTWGQLKEAVEQMGVQDDWLLDYCEVYTRYDRGDEGTPRVYADEDERVFMFEMNV